MDSITKFGGSYIKPQISFNDSFFSNCSNTIDPQNLKMPLTYHQVKEEEEEEIKVKVVKMESLPFFEEENPVVQFTVS